MTLKRGFHGGSVGLWARTEVPPDFAPTPCHSLAFARLASEEK
uniref:Uncharacterized protein n=1 Tax=Anguilla anguilla TaxID=7936 RepID=A0A0E9TVS9_ANGAN